MNIQDIKKNAPLLADGFGLWNGKIYYSKGEFVYSKKTNEWVIANKVFIKSVTRFK